MVQALAAFLDFCYIVCQSSLDEADLDALDNALHHFETEHVIFETEGICSDGICQDWFFTDLISTRGQGVRGWPSGKTEMLCSVVALPK